jgi:tetratricopeptide (TPR) repeat protein
MVAAVVGAEENTGVERARQLFLQAQTRYQAGEYAQAAALFDQSHAALPRIELVYNAGLSYLWAADCENARSRFETYVAGVSAVRDHSRVQQAVQSMRGRSDTVGSDPLCALVARLRLAISIAEGGSSSDTTAAEDAQRFFQIAQQRYRQRNYREAARFMLIAHEILPIPALAYNVGVCYQWSVDYDAARDWFRRYITGKSEIAGCPEVQTANRALEGAGRTTSQLYCQRISDLKRAIARCDNDTRPGTTVKPHHSWSVPTPSCRFRSLRTTSA